MQPSLAKQFLWSLIKSGKLGEWTSHGNLSALFLEGESGYVSFFSDFVAKYGQFPSVEAFTLHTKEDLPEASDPPGYYRDRLKMRHRERAIKLLLASTSKSLSAAKVGWDQEALDGMRGLLRDLNALEYGAHMIDMREAGPLVKAAYVAEATGSNTGLTLGWKKLDAMSGGIKLGDMVGIAGRPGVGKTWAMLYAALAGYREAESVPDSWGSPRLFVTMEMNALSVAQRIASMLASVPFGGVKKGQLTNNVAFSDEYGQFKKVMNAASGYKAPFWIVDGNMSSTVEEVADLAAQLKPDAVFIDAAYLLKHPTERDRYKRVAENADLIKKRIANTVCPVVCSWQLNREAAKKGKGGKAKTVADEPSIDDLAYADAVGQVSSLVLGIYPSPNEAGPAQRLVRVLKGRSGEVGEFRINWDFFGMLFDEVASDTENDWGQ